jgi:hypothetical protein
MGEKLVDKDPGRAEYVPKKTETKKKVTKLLPICYTSMKLMKFICSIRGDLKMEIRCG